MGAASGINIGSVGGDFSLQAGGDIVAGNKTVITNIIQRLAKELTTTPYKFLASYDIADRDIFYGRAAVVEELAGAVARHKAIIINGASGAGKSSLVNAGVIPRLADNGYSYVAFREYSDPLEQLTHLGKLLADSPLPRTGIGSDNAAPPPQKAADGVSSSESGATAAGEAPDLNDPGLLLQLIRAVHTTPIVVVFDQFERFFVNVPPEKRSAFIAAFKHCLQHSTAQEINFVFALRHEFYGQLLLEFEAQIPEFSNEAYRLNLLPLTQSEAREAIVKPLANTSLKVQYDEDFVDHVLLAGLAAQTGGSTNVNPPHLQIVCNQLFEAARQRLQQRSSVLIDEKLYNELGGVQTILNTYLDKMVEEVANDPRRITVVRSVLQRMIDTTGTRRFVTEELLKRELPDVNEAEILAFIQKLLDRRVVEERKPTYSLSHEYLVKRVKDWFDPVEMARKRAQETLERGLAEWKNSQALLNRPQVEAVRKWVNVLGAEEQQLLQDSEADYQKREREEAASKSFRRRAVRIGTGFAIAAFLVVSALGVIALMESKSARMALSKAEANGLGLTARQQFESGQQIEALFAAIEAGHKLRSLSGRRDAAFEKYPVVTPLLALQMVLDNISERNKHDEREGSVSPPPDPGRTGSGACLVPKADGTPVQLDKLPEPELRALMGHRERVLFKMCSPDQHYLVTSATDSTIRMLDLRGGRAGQLVGLQGGVTQMTFSPDGRLLTTIQPSWGNEIQWDLSGANQARHTTELKGHSAPVVSISFSDRLIATTGQDGTIRIWTTEGQQIGGPISTRLATEGIATSTASSGEPLMAVRLSPDGTRVLSVGERGTISQWNRDGSVVRPVASQNGQSTDTDVIYAAISPDGRKIATALAGGGVRVYDVLTQQSLSLPSQSLHSGWIMGLAFDATGKMLATAGADGKAGLWVTSGKPIGPAIRANQGQLTSIAFNPTRKGLATAGENGTVKLWTLSGEQTGELIGHEGKVLRVCFRGDGALIASMGADGTVRLWRPTGEQLAQFAVHVGFLSSELVGGGFGSMGMSFSQDGQQVAVAENGGIVRLWRIQNLSELLNVGCEWLGPFLASHPEAPRVCG